MNSSVFIKKHPRVEVADVLRGFAVMAIILLHSIEHFNFYSFPDTAGQATWLDFTDKAIWNGLFFAFGGKAYAIFALLFGFSFFIQDDNQRMRGKDFRLRFGWRLFWLFIIGQIDACFFTGEILVLYALVGVVLIFTCRLSNRWIIILSTICLLQPVCLWQIINALSNLDYEIMHINSGPFWKATFEAQTNGTFLEMARVNLWEGQLASLAWAWEHGRIFQTAALFMLGMLIGRQNWFSSRALKGWGTVLALALVCFFPLSGIYNMIGDYVANPNLLTPLRTLLSSLVNLSFMLILVSGILYAYYHTVTLKKWLSLLIPYGRMSMTNYVTQGIIGSAIYYHWGLYLRVGISTSILIGILIFICQLTLCRWWFRHHIHGPLEYFWKRMTWLGTKNRDCPK